MTARKPPHSVPLPRHSRAGGNPCGSWHPASGRPAQVPMPKSTLTMDPRLRQDDCEKSQRTPISTRHSRVRENGTRTPRHSPHKPSFPRRRESILTLVLMFGRRIRACTPLGRATRESKQPDVDQPIPITAARSHPPALPGATARTTRSLLDTAASSDSATA